MNRKYVLCLCLLSLIMGCQKDDLCPETTETTPLLVLDFLDSEERDRLKAAEDLVVIASDMEDTLLGPENTNNIAVPLRTDQNVTEYRFILNAGSETENTDTIRFSYIPSTEYLNRACGFKVNFEDMQVNLVEDENNWISSFIQVQDDNETDTDISFFH